MTVVRVLMDNGGSYSTTGDAFRFEGGFVVVTLLGSDVAAYNREHVRTVQIATAS